MYGWGWGWLGALWMVLFWAGIILLVVWAVKALSSNDSRFGGSAGSRGLEILEERYARGEIDRDEFVSRRDELRRG